MCTLKIRKRHFKEYNIGFYQFAIYATLFKLSDAEYRRIYNLWTSPETYSIIMKEDTLSSLASKKGVTIQDVEFFNISKVVYRILFSLKFEEEVLIGLSLV